MWERCLARISSELWCVQILKRRKYGGRLGNILCEIPLSHTKIKHRARSGPMKNKIKWKSVGESPESSLTKSRPIQYFERLLKSPAIKKQSPNPIQSYCWLLTSDRWLVIIFQKRSKNRKVIYLDEIIL